MRLIRLIYASYHGGLSPHALDEILAQSRANNDRDGITGALVHSKEDFMQLLEGERLLVTKCFMRILLDDRHRDIQIVFAKDDCERLFDAWTMYSVKASRIDRKTLTECLIDGSFQPSTLSSAQAESLYQKLSSAT